MREMLAQSDLVLYTLASDNIDGNMLPVVVQKLYHLDTS